MKLENLEWANSSTTVTEWSPQPGEFEKGSFACGISKKGKLFRLQQEEDTKNNLTCAYPFASAKTGLPLISFEFAPRTSKTKPSSPSPTLLCQSITSHLMRPSFGYDLCPCLLGASHTALVLIHLGACINAWECIT